MKQRWEVISRAACLVGESPVWDAQRRILHYVDIQGCRLRHLDWRTGQCVDEVLPQQIGSVVPLSDGRLLGCLEDGVYLLPGNGIARPLFRPPFPLAGPRFNDCKAGPDNTLWGGTIHYGSQGKLYRVTQDGQWSILLEGIGNSNGLAWEEERRLFYYIDTPTGDCMAYSWDVEKGTLGARRVIRHFQPEEGKPDGMTIDAEGMLWIALWSGGKVVRVSPQDGRILDTIELPTPNVTCCAFAGDDCRELVITTAAAQTMLRDFPLAGALFRVKVPVPGRPPFQLNL